MYVCVNRKAKAGEKLWAGEAKEVYVLNDGKVALDVEVNGEGRDLNPGLTLVTKGKLVVKAKAAGDASVKVTDRA